MSWEKRVNGLQYLTTGSVSQLAFETLIWDPWWFTEYRQFTYDPEQVILHGAGKGFLTVSQNAGKNWEDRTGFLGTTGPPNSWSDDPPPAMNQVIVKQVHGDIHKLGRFCGIAQLATGTATDARGWLLVTDNDWIDTEWHAMSIIVANPTDWRIAPDITDPGSIVTTPSGLMGSGTVDNDGGQFTISSVQSTVAPNRYHVALCVSIYADQVPGCGWSVPCYDVVSYGGTVTFFSVSGSDTPPFQDVRGMRATLANCGGAPVGGTPFGGTPSTQNNAQYIHWVDDTPFSMTFSIDSPPILCGSGVLPVSPIALDVDNETGLRCYVTAWKDGDMVLQNWDVTNTTPTLNSTYTIATVTISEIEQKTAYAVPYCSADFETSDFGNHVYLFGFFDGKHIIKSTDGGATFGSNLGDGSWGTNRVAAFFTLSTTEFYAFLNVGATCEIWHTTNGGTSWVKRNTLPLNVEHETVSRHASGALLIGNSIIGTPAAVLLSTAPYEGTYQDVTGPAAGSRLPGVGDGGGGLSSIIWVG